MKTPIYFLLVTMILVSSCEDTRYTVVPEEALKNLTYEQFRGTMEMDSDFNIYLAESNSLEFEADISIEVGEGTIIFSSLEFEFDLDESNIYGANACQIYGAHCSDNSTVKRLYFEPGGEFWECVSLENCDPDDEVLVFEVFVRKGE